jgi:hypothetical protein
MLLCKDAGGTLSINIHAEINRAFPAPGTIKDFKCLHPEVEIRIRRQSNETWVYWKQCLQCGAPVGSAIAKNSVTGVGIKEWDTTLDPSTPYQQNAAAQEAWRVARDAYFWQLYNEYLASPEWKTKRELVLKRDSWICQGCLSATAIEVHHRTYKHVGMELLYEPISLCYECHMNVEHASTGTAA